MAKSNAKHTSTFFFIFLAWRRARGPLAGVLALLLTALPAAAQTLTATAYTDYPPFTTDDLPRNGFSTALVEDAFAAGGYEVEHVWQPWKRGYAETAAAAIDFTHPYRHSPARAAEMHFSDPMFRITSRLYAKPDMAEKLRTVDALDGHRVCSPLGYALPQSLTEKVGKGLIDRAQPPEMKACFRMLLAGRVDAINTNAMIRKNILDALDVPEERVVASDLTLDTVTFHVLVSRTHKRADEIIEAFNAGLEEIRENGTLDALAREYGIPTSMLMVDG